MKENFLIYIKSKEEHDKVFNKLVSLGYTWRDGSTKYYEFAGQNFLVRDGIMYHTSFGPAFHSYITNPCIVIDIKDFLQEKVMEIE